MGLFKKSKAKAALLDSTALSTPHLSVAQTLKKTWQLSRPYLVDDPERRKTHLLIAAIAATAATQVGLMNWGNDMYARMWQSFAERDISQLWAPLKEFVPWAGSMIAANMARPYLTNRLITRWSQAMTSKLQDDWIESDAALKLQQMPKSDATENPHQQIASGVKSFVASTVGNTISLAEKTAMLALFAKVLWQVSGALPLTIGKHRISIPAYMLCLAALYSGVGTWAINKLSGKKMTALYNDQRKHEAAHEEALVRAKDNAESIALSGGQKIESGILSEKYNRVVKNSLALIKKSTSMNGLYSAFGMVSSMVPALGLAAKLFAKTMDYGGFTRGIGAFFHVDQALSWFVYSNNELAQHRTDTARLSGFIEGIEKCKDQKKTASNLRDAFIDAGQPAALQLRQLAIHNPKTLEPLIEPFTLELKPGDRLFLSAKSGKGKTSLFRVLAGTHDNATGHVTLRSAKKLLCVAQDPHLASLTLRGLICYPEKAAQFKDDEIKAALKAAGLKKKYPDLDNQEILGEQWEHTLSGGEKHRVILARVLLHKPDLLLLDEVTRSLDAKSAHKFYTKVTEMLPHSIILSVAHDKSLVAYHNLRAHIVNRQLTVSPLPPLGLPQKPDLKASEPAYEPA